MFGAIFGGVLMGLVSGVVVDMLFHNSTIAVVVGVGVGLWLAYIVATHP